jgi:hypothetical protein
MGGVLVGGLTGLLVGPLAGLGSGFIVAVIIDQVSPRPMGPLQYSSDGTIFMLPFVVLMLMIIVGPIIGVITGITTACIRSKRWRVLSALVIGLMGGVLLSDYWLWACILAMPVTALIVENKAAAAVWAPKR